MEESEFLRPLLNLLAEVHGLSEAPTGFVLDSGQAGVFGQIHTLDVQTVSQPVPDGGETIAAHCQHLLYAARFFLAIERGERASPNWEQSWVPQVVNDDEWETLKYDLRNAYESIINRLQARRNWPTQAVGASMMLLAHTAYHVGVIDKMLTILTDAPDC